MIELWNCKDPKEWDYCESELYDAAVKSENRNVERELEKPGLRERIARMTTAQFYDFLRDEYYKWKFTSKPLLIGNTNALSKHVKDGTMERVERVRQRLINRGDDTKGASIRMIMAEHGGIHGLAVAGASGLLALVYPEEFGTVDRKVTEALQQIGLPEVMKANPKKISIEEAETMIEVMRVKALELNRMFRTNKWRPRLIDRVLWVAGR